ncbi:hypothetical protein EV421DRAFT_1734929 [Armillaria borealis]|uniref:Uncharacterized protein n=1 Tax=Armillaria borealis TaxID=47425 RepID=A0AA39JM17_9AGAR|nr:hypothetical protein EV421DRAFT_1734929 [Armillaria borealis]
MAEPTDPVELAALNTYNDTYGKLANLQDNLPNPDFEGAIDAWVLNVHSLWKIMGANWEKAGISSRAWHGVETTLVETLPKIHEDSITIAFSEYNELRQNEINIFPLPIPDCLLRQKTPANRARSQSSSSPALSCQKSVVPLANISRQPTQTPQRPKQPIPPVTSPHPALPTPVMLKEKTPVPPPHEPASSLTKRPSSSMTKSIMGASSLFPLKPLADSSFLGLKGIDVSLGGAAASSYNVSVFQRPGWGSPAWSPAPSSDNESPSPSRSSYGLSFGMAALLPSPQSSKTGPSMAIPLSRSRLLTVDAATRPALLLGPDPTRREGSVPAPSSFFKPLFYPGTDDEEEQSCGVMVDEENVEESDGEDSVSQGQEDVPTPPMDALMDVNKEPTQQSDDTPSPPPTKVCHQKPKISFVFDDTTGNFEDPHPTIFLPRPQVLTSQEQALRRSTHPPASSVGPDTTYLQVVWESKAVLKKKKKDAKDKFKKTEGAIPYKRAQDDKGGPSIDKPAAKRLKSTTTTVADTKVARPTKAFCKRGPVPAKPLAVTMGVSGGGFREKVPASAKEVKNGIKSISALVVERDFGDFVEVDKAYWNKEVAPFVGEQYTEGCDHCKCLGMQCRKFLTNTVICVRCHYSKLPCKVKGILALNPLSHYRPNSYRNLNTFQGALDTLDQHADALEDQIISYLAGLNALTQLNGLRVQAGRLRKCAVYNEEGNEDNGSKGDDEDEDEVVAEGVTGPSKKKKSKSG